MQGSKEQFMQLRSEEMELHSGIIFEHLIGAKKSNIANAINTIVTHVSDGNEDSLNALILAIKGKALFDGLEKALRPLANKDYLDKLEKNHSKHDALIEQSSTKTEYDYTVCQDPDWNALDALNDANKKLQKEREAFLKGLKSPMVVVDEDTGETYKIYPPNKLQSEGLKITIK